MRRSRVMVLLALPVGLAAGALISMLTGSSDVAAVIVFFLVFALCLPEVRYQRRDRLER